MAKESKNIRDFQQAAITGGDIQSMSPADFGFVEGPPAVPKRSQQLGCSFGGASWLKSVTKGLDPWQKLGLRSGRFRKYDYCMLWSPRKMGESAQQLGDFSSF